MEYTTLTYADQLLLANDRLRGIESDHFRLLIAPTSPEVQTGRLEVLEEMAEDVKKEVRRLENLVETSEVNQPFVPAKRALFDEAPIVSDGPETESPLKDIENGEDDS